MRLEIRKRMGYPEKVRRKEMKPGDLVKWTFAKTSPNINKEKKFYVGILLERQDRPRGSWLILLSDGGIVHGDETEIEEICDEDR